MARRLLWASLALAPITTLLDVFVHPDKTALFVLAALSLIPLAWLIGEATEHAGEHTGPRIGGLLNASFGNAPEVIIALIAVADNLPDVVRGSVAGSIVSNILLVLGAALVLGKDNAELDRRSLLSQLGLVLVSCGRGAALPTGTARSARSIGGRRWPLRSVPSLPSLLFARTGYGTLSTGCPEATHAGIVEGESRRKAGPGSPTRQHDPHPSAVRGESRSVCRVPARSWGGRRFPTPALVAFRGPDTTGVMPHNCRSRHQRAQDQRSDPSP